MQSTISRIKSAVTTVTDKPNPQYTDFSLEIQNLTPGSLILLFNHLKSLHPDVANVTASLNVTFYSCDENDKDRVMKFLNEGWFEYERRN